MNEEHGYSIAAIFALALLLFAHGVWRLAFLTIETAALIGLVNEVTKKNS